MKLHEEYDLITDLDRATELGWDFQKDLNRVRILPSETVRAALGLTDSASWTMPTYTQAIAFALGMSEMVQLAVLGNSFKKSVREALGR